MASSASLPLSQPFIAMDEERPNQFESKKRDTRSLKEKAKDPIFCGIWTARILVVAALIGYLVYVIVKSLISKQTPLVQTATSTFSAVASPGLYICPMSVFGATLGSPSCDFYPSGLANPSTSCTNRMRSANITYPPLAMTLQNCLVASPGTFSFSSTSQAVVFSFSDILVQVLPLGGYSSGMSVGNSNFVVAYAGMFYKADSTGSPVFDEKTLDATAPLSLSGFTSIAFFENSYTYINGTTTQYVTTSTRSAPQVTLSYISNGQTYYNMMGAITLSPGSMSKQTFTEYNSFGPVDAIQSFLTTTGTLTSFLAQYSGPGPYEPLGWLQLLILPFIFKYIFRRKQ